MATKVIPVLSGEAVTANTDYEAAPGGWIISLGYKSMTDKATGKAKDKPNNFVFAAPNMDLPTTENAALDSILRSAMEGYAESMVRTWREEEGNPDEYSVTLTEELTEEQVEQVAEYFGSPDAMEELAPQTTDAAQFLAYVIEHAEAKAASLKLSEQSISAWFKAEGADACKASYMIANNLTTADTPANVAAMPAVEKAVANMGVLFSKLAAPTPDIEPKVAKVLLSRIAILTEPSSTTQAIRRKLEQRVEMEKKAADLLTAI